MSGGRGAPWRGCRHAAGAVAAVGLALAACTADPRDGPHPDLSPEQVVSLQLDALQRLASGGGDEALATAMRFASPGNRRAIGTPQRFREMLENPMYAPLLHHRDATVGEGRPRNGDVQVPVDVTGRDGRRRGYVYTLARHDLDGCPGCWLVEGVVPRERRDEAPPQRPAEPPELVT